MKKLRVPILTEEYAINVYIGNRAEIIKEGAKECGDQPLSFGMQFDGRRGMACNLLMKPEPRHPLIVLDGDLPADVALSTLAHEASHAMDYITDFVQLDDRSGEFKGHGIGAVMRAVTKLFINKKAQEDQLTPDKTV